jgi:hypothetical protein
MLRTKLKYGVPNIELDWSSGGTVNPTCFVGHQLVVLFLPKDARQQTAEFESYEKLAEELSGTDAWFLVVGDRPYVKNGAKTPVALDPDDKAWAALKEIAGDAKLDRSTGAVFFFTRGGAFHRAWAGVGNADAVVKELLSRS